MRPGWLLAFALSCTMLAGCTSSTGDGEAPAAPQNVVTDPRDYSYLQNATPGSHIHDYWQGRDRVTVLERAGGPFSSSCSGGCEDGMTFTWGVPEDGVIVPQGTKWVNGTFSLTPEGENTWTRLELWVRTAQDPEAQKWGDLENGKPFSIESTAEKNDPPHYVLSRWEFAVRAYSGTADVAVRGEYAWQVEAVRGLPLLPYPPHPDRWNGATELELLEETRASMLTTYDEDPVSGGQSYSCYNGCPGTHRLGDGVVVPFETATVEVRIAYGPGVPALLGVTYHGSDTRSFTRLAGTTESPGVTLFTIPLDPGVADSPYARQSLWEFDVWMEYPNDPPLQAWSGEYTITVKAVKG